MASLIDTVIGLLLTFLVFSIVVSGVNEWCAQAFARRGHFLRIGMRRLINDDAFFNRVLHHPLIGSLYRTRAAQGKPPSYVGARNFALAIADIVVTRANGAGTLTASALCGALRAPVNINSPLAVALSPVLARAGDDLDLALKGIEEWFNAGMDRVGGWYKARTQKLLFVIGLLVAIVCNVDAIELFRALNHSATMRAEFVSLAQGMVDSGKIGDVNLTDLKDRAPTQAEWQSLRPMVDVLRNGKGGSLPIGYSCLGAAVESVDARKSRSTVSSGPWSACTRELAVNIRDVPLSSWLLKVLGWTLTALAGTLGAAYWFELLGKAINMRGSGQKPVKGAT